MNLMAINCPSCGMALFMRSSNQLSPTLRIGILSCNRCSNQYSSEIEVVHSLSASSEKSNEVRLDVIPSTPLFDATSDRTAKETIDKFTKVRIG
ncbi:ogr/Delta-like zinc finger family protein [Burkholderia diffusa]|uniref:ogr/Delta-like zinc finger family protein n=1 Tax=Burkholderia diffusa TaxID=488732 RepID=UPI003C79AA93